MKNILTFIALFLSLSLSAQFAGKLTRLSSPTPSTGTYAVQGVFASDEGFSINTIDGSGDYYYLDNDGNQFQIVAISNVSAPIITFEFNNLTGESVAPSSNSESLIATKNTATNQYYLASNLSKGYTTKVFRVNTLIESSSGGLSEAEVRVISESSCLQNILFTAHGVITPSLQPVFRLSGNYSLTLPPNVDIAPIGIISNVINSDSLVLRVCGQEPYVIADGKYYWENNTVTSVTTRDTLTPLFQVANNIAVTSFGEVFDISTPQIGVFTDGTSATGDGTLGNPITVPGYTPDFIPFVGDFSVRFDNVFKVLVNGTPASFTGLTPGNTGASISDDGNGTVTITGVNADGTGGGTIDEISIGDRIDYVVLTDPEPRAGRNNAATFGISKVDLNPSRFSEEYLIYTGGNRTVTVQKGSTVGFTSATDFYGLNDTLSIEVEVSRVVFFKNGVEFFAYNDQQEPLLLTTEQSFTQLNNRKEASVTLIHTKRDSTVEVGVSEYYIPVGQDIAGTKIVEGVFVSNTTFSGTATDFLSYRVNVRSPNGTVTNLMSDAFSGGGNFSLRRINTSTYELKIGDILYLEVLTVPTGTVGNGLMATIHFSNE